MAKQIQNNRVACVEIPMWEIAQGPHYDDLQVLPDNCYSQIFLTLIHVDSIKKPSQCDVI